MNRIETTSIENDDRFEILKMAKRLPLDQLGKLVDIITRLLRDEKRTNEQMVGMTTE